MVTVTKNRSHNTIYIYDFNNKEFTYITISGHKETNPYEDEGYLFCDHFTNTHDGLKPSYFEIYPKEEILFVGDNVNSFYEQFPEYFI